jgi:NAD(P)-dependent dehydrogenase (short-subunit alcohol dehydrogenase family)
MYTLSNFTHIPKKAEKWINMFANTNNQIKAYVLSKFAMALLAQSFNKQGICATSVHPGIVQTNIFNNAISPTSRALLRNIMKKRLTSLQSAAEYVVSCVENDIPSNKYNCAGKIVDLNRAACCERNISNLDAMNKHIMEKYGLKSL